MAIVESLHVFPVKSLRGISLAEARVERRGVRHDRRWMLVDGAGRFLSQREEPRLALVDVAIDEPRAQLVVTAPGEGELLVPFAPRGAPREVVIWDDRVSAVSVSPEAADYFCRYLGRAVDLVFMPEETERAVDPRYARAGDVVGFADGFPLLLIAKASLADLNARMPAPVPMARFRPNIVVDGVPAFAEDAWSAVRIGALGCRVQKPCERCVIPTVDIETGEMAKEPLATLATFRRRGNAVLFGQNLSPDGEGTLRVGDALSVV